MDKPGSWFLLAKRLKNTCGRASLLKMSLFHQVFFKHFANENQLLGSYISGKLVENEVNRSFTRLSNNFHF